MPHPAHASAAAFLLPFPRAAALRPDEGTGGGASGRTADGPAERPIEGVRPALPRLGVFGGEHAARRLQRAGRALGIDVRCLPAPEAPAARAASDAWLDPLALAPLAPTCDVVTAAAEHVPAPTLAAAAGFASVRPAPTLLGIAQDRAREKRWLDVRAGHAAPWRVAHSAAELRDAVAALAREDEGAVHGTADGACVAKPLLRRADGAAPVRVARPADADAAWTALGGAPCVVERVLDIEWELTVLVARSPRGAEAVYPVALNHREGVSLAWSVLPAPVPPQIARKAQRLASFYATRLAVEGLLAVELFVLTDGRLVVNELVPCPHPAFDATDAACDTDQFEQLVRAVCDLPLGPTELAMPAASVPLRAGTHGAALAALAEAAGPRERLYAARDDDGTLALALPGTRVVWHNEEASSVCPSDGAPDGVVAHVTATGETPEDAVARARHVAHQLRDPRLAVRRLLRARPAPPDETSTTDYVPGYPWRRRFAAP